MSEDAPLYESGYQQLQAENVRGDWHIQHAAALAAENRRLRAEVVRLAAALASTNAELARLLREGCYPLPVASEAQTMSAKVTP